jgi:hypothetical protein
MTPQATKHFQWDFHVSSVLDAIPRSRRKGSLLLFGVDPQENPGSVVKTRAGRGAELMQDGEDRAERNTVATSPN